ncbi:hypothetical protein [Brevibacillus reuszeri]|uniref:hypothetical protein n=1 Tax=Brevibacillus reuszeri TaxID=54915 RepID=UPI0013DFEC8B|nr:hypothetical protein [Brevibacillus reuszeri]
MSVATNVGCHIEIVKVVNVRNVIDAKNVRKAFQNLEEDLAVGASTVPDAELIQRTNEEIEYYHFMISEIARLQGVLEDKNKVLVHVSKERKQKRLRKLQETVKLIESAANSITDEREKTVLDAIMDGEKNYIIANQLGMSRQRYYEIKRSLISNMAWLMYVIDKKS